MQYFPYMYISLHKISKHMKHNHTPMLIPFYLLILSKDIRTVTWKDICAGDIIRVSCDEMIPADMLFVSGSNSHGTCFVETASLDGENNLKQRHLVAGSVLEVVFFVQNLTFLFKIYY